MDDNINTTIYKIDNQQGPTVWHRELYSIFVITYKGKEGFPVGSVVKNPPANARDMDSIPGLGRSPGEGNGNPLQYSCLRNPMGRGARQAAVHGASKELDMT